MSKVKELIVYMLIILTLVFLAGCTTIEENLDETNKTNTAKQSERLSIPVYEDSYMKVTYIGIDYEESGLVFEVFNKSEQNFYFTFDSILVNGQTEQPAYGTSVLSNSKADCICDVSSPEDISAITGVIEIYDDDGLEIEKQSVKDIKIK